MAVPQLQLANLGEIFAQNQAKQAAMDTMQLQQASAVEKMRQEQLARQKQSQLMDLARTVDISKPEGAKQAFELGLMDLPTYTGVQKSATDMALAKQRTKTAEIQGESSLRTATAAERRVDAQANRYRSQNRIDQARLDLDRQNTEREYGADLTETFINTSVNILGLPLKEQKDSYNAVKPLIEKMTGEKLPEWENGGQDAVKAYAALRKPQGKGGTVTMPDGTVIESGNFNETQKLRKEYFDRSKEFIDIRNSYSALQAVSANPSAAGDISIVFSFMKMLDPISVVREGEQATVRNAAGIPDRIRNIYNKALTGEGLAPDQRQDILNQAKTLYDKASEQQERNSKTYINISERSGLDPNLVVPDITLAQPTPTGGGQGGGVQKWGRDANGNPVRVQ
jgi:hypothetical protein